MRVLFCSVVLLLAGCASPQHSEEALVPAREAFQQVKSDPQVLQYAAKDVLRAGESLARAERLAGYWGSAGDVQHFAYLSQAYSAIAREHTQQALNRQRLQRLQGERERLQLSLREARLLSVQQHSQWLEDQVLSLQTEGGERGLVLSFADMAFDTGRAELKAVASRTLLKIVQLLQLNPARVVRVEGYSDSLGNKAMNMQLSQQRAQAVADALVDLGIRRERVEVVGYGEAYPLSENASARGRAQNRRVEVVFSDERGRLPPARP